MAWLGSRTASVSRFQEGVAGLSEHLEQCLKDGRLDDLLQQNASGCVYLVTKTHEVESWATTVRQEESMKFGVRFSEATGACAGFGWRGASQENSSLPSSTPEGSSVPKSAAFLSGFYIFARQSTLPHTSGSGATTAVETSRHDTSLPDLSSPNPPSSSDLGATGSQNSFDAQGTSPKVTPS